MDQLSPWLLASTVLVSAGVCLLVLRRMLDAERRRADLLSAVHLSTMEALALAISAKDHTAHDHVRRVQVYATGLAREIGMDSNQVEAVRTAAILHDIGKLAVPDHIIARPGPLSPEELEKVRLHPQIGAEIIAPVPFPFPVAPLIRSHHEHWDGSGYPEGRRGEDIPLGARVIGIAEHFDALTSGRSYRKALTSDEAAGLLQQRAGRELDPTLVEAFLRILPQLRPLAEPTEPAPPRFTSPPVGPVQPSAGPAQGPVRTVFEDIAVAHREIYALYEIAQTMGTGLGVEDTMALIASRLANVVPLSSCALFLHSETDDRLFCRFAGGTDADLMQPLVVPNGHGVIGWVARNRRPLVNARPAADMEAGGSTSTTRLQAALVCPLLSGGRLIGTLSVYHTTPGIYRDDHRRLLDRVCEQAGAVISNAIVYERTHEASLTDPLTGLPNTRYMSTHLARELARAERLESEVSLLVLDLNDFKDINDTFGHQTGDRALREVAHVLRAAIRPYDLCVRYAGDEFIVVLAGCGRDEAENKRLELQRAVARLVFEPEPGTRIPLSISAGAAVFPHDGDSYDALLATADSRMYGEKGTRKRDLQQQPPDAAGDTLGTSLSQRHH
jgi:diguanylate cyclase (GGDEF)-like protein/putative nucleotidyltransferase with HDIG domain